MKKIFVKNTIGIIIMNWLRLLLLSLIIAVGVGVVTGVGSLPFQMRDAIQILEANSESPQLISVLNNVADNIEVISMFFSAFFIAISALVVFISMTRFADEQRANIACARTQGYSKFRILLPYLIFTLIVTVAGCGLGLIVGHYGVSPVLYNSIETHFNLPSVSGFYDVFGFWSFAMMTILLLFTTIFVVYNKTKEVPASMLLPRAPKDGKKVLLEKIPFIWKLFSFNSKSTMRNLFRYPVRFITTVISVLGASALIFCGIGLYISLKETNPELIDAIGAISVTVVLCAVMLSVLIIYNITNMNIEERKREIAILRVLGYTNYETANYIYREIFVLAFLGTVLGLPVGYGMLSYVFSAMDFGSLDQVKWYVWAGTGLISLVAAIIVDAILFFKIKTVNMDDTLKAVE